MAPVHTVERYKAAMDSSQRRGVGLRWGQDGKVVPINGLGHAIVAQSFADPVEALEAAEAAYMASEQRAARNGAEKWVAAVERGLYYPAPDADGWVVVDVTNGAAVGGLLSYRGALIEIARLNDLIDNPATPPTVE